MKLNKKFLLLITLLLVSSILFTACVPGGEEKPPVEEPTGEAKPEAGGEDVGKSQAPADKILRTNNSSEPGSLDPALAQGTHESWILDHTFEGLMKIDQDLKVVPGMAKDYTVSDDFKWRPCNCS